MQYTNIGKAIYLLSVLERQIQLQFKETFILNEGCLSSLEEAPSNVLLTLCLKANPNLKVSSEDSQNVFAQRRTIVHGLWSWSLSSGKLAAHKTPRRYNKKTSPHSTHFSSQEHFDSFYGKIERISKYLPKFALFYSVEILGAFYEHIGEFVKAFSQTELLLRLDVFRRYPEKIAEEVSDLAENLDILLLLDSYCVLLQKNDENEMLNRTNEIKKIFRKINNNRNEVIHKCGFRKYTVEELKEFTQECIDLRSKIMGSENHEFEFMSEK